MWLSLALVAACGTVRVLADLPIVDLGYIQQQAVALNTTGAYYNFSNIRFAEAPVGKLRFKPPTVPTTINRTVTDGGNVPIMCPQASPCWETIAESFLIDYLLNNTSAFNYSEQAKTACADSTNIKAVTPQVPGAQEDCLFLDVFTPSKVFTGNLSAPVLVWIYGGGFVGGSKTSSGSAAGLMHASMAGGSDGLVIVAINYRLGALGWMGGTTVQSAGVAQPGLYDQRFALGWVQEHISKFGGDPNQVTVMGESAGASSILHQITAYGGSKGPAPFHRAIPQSPAFQPMPDVDLQQTVAEQFLKILNVTTFEEAQGLTSDQVITANSFQVGQSIYGTFTFGPVVDGVFAPDLPGALLAEGKFDKNVSVVVGHNEDEGLLFSNPEVNSTADLTTYYQILYPKMSKSVVAYIEDVLYPSDFSGKYGYTNNFERYVNIVSEFAVTCNSVYLDMAFSDKDYAYEFDIPPALHGEDVAYTWYNGADTDNYGLALNSSTAIALQEYLTSFALTGIPKAAGYPVFSILGTNNSIVQFGGESTRITTNDISLTRCAFWQQGLYLGQEITTQGQGVAEPGAPVISATASITATATAIYSGTVVSGASIYGLSGYPSVAASSGSQSQSGKTTAATTTAGSGTAGSATASANSATASATGGASSATVGPSLVLIAGLAVLASFNT